MVLISFFRRLLQDINLLMWLKLDWQTDILAICNHKAIVIAFEIGINVQKLQKKKSLLPPPCSLCRHLAKYCTETWTLSLPLFFFVHFVFWDFSSRLASAPANFSQSKSTVMERAFHLHLKNWVGQTKLAMKQTKPLYKERGPGLVMLFVSLLICTLFVVFYYCIQ